MKRIPSKIVLITTSYLALQFTLHATDIIMIKVLIVICLGFLMVGLYTLGHEIVHQRISKSRFLDIIIGQMIMIPMFVDFTEYIKGHTLHHGYSTTSEDPGYVDRPNSKVVHYLFLVLHYLNLTYLVTIPIDTLISIKKNGIIKGSSHLFLIAILFGLVIYFSDFSAFLWHLLFPYIGFCFFNTTKNAAEHDYLYQGEEGNRRQNLTTRSIRSHRITKFFWSNCMYHKEHHLNPRVPYYKLPSFSTESDISYMSYIQFTFLRYKEGLQYPFFI